MTTYREEKDKQLAILAELKAVNAVLKELRPKVHAEKQNKTGSTQYATAFKLEKAKHAEILKQLQAANAILAELRAAKVPAVRDNSAAKAAREAIQAEKAAKKAAAKATKDADLAKVKAERAAERQRKAEQRELERERRAEELEAQGRSAKGYTFPLLSDKEREATTISNKAFAMCSDVTKEIAARKRAEIFAAL